MRMFRTVLLDITLGLKQAKLKYIFGFSVTLFCCAIMSIQMQRHTTLSGESAFAVTYFDCVLYNLRGMKMYSPNLDGEYVIPMVWLIYQVLVALIVGDYPYRSLQGIGNNILINCGSRKKWMISKYIYAVVSVVLFYAVAFFAMFLYSVFSGAELSLLPSKLFSYVFFDLNTEKVVLYELVICTFLMPIFTSSVISIMQTTLSFIIKPYVSFIFVSVYALVCTFKTSPMLIGNASMIIRSRFFITDGLMIEECAFWLLIYAAVFLVLGLIIISRKNILKRND